MKKTLLLLFAFICFLCTFNLFAENNFAANSYVFQSVQAGQNIILTNEKGEKIGMLRVMSPEIIICFDNENKKIGIIARQGNLAVLFDNNNKRLGVIEKLGSNYVLNKTLDSNKQNKEIIHINN